MLHYRKDGIAAVLAGVAMALLTFLVPGQAHAVSALPASTHTSTARLSAAVPQAPSVLMEISAHERQLRHQLPVTVYAVRAGDTFASIAVAHGLSCQRLAADNPQITDPSVIYPGQKVWLTGSSKVQETSCGSPPSAVLVSSPGTASAPYAPPGSSFQACVESRESGGDAQVMNSTGHYGLYQFSYALWVEGGGAPGLFGNASASYQTMVFWNIMDNAAVTGGASNWAPYDGC